MLKILLILLFIFHLPNASLGEEVPAGYVAKWQTIPLTDEDYIDTHKKDCKTFSSILSQAKLEWPHTAAFQIINDTLLYFIAGYNIQEKLDADKIVIWPDYGSSEWYVLMGRDNCFVRWIEIQPDNIQSIILSGMGLDSSR